MPALFHLYWQNPSAPIEKEVVAQGWFDNRDTMAIWANEIIEERYTEAPDGWVPLLMEYGKPKEIKDVLKWSPCAS